ncbi:response regulator [bacterium]|nr:response regulator [bacterium]
MSKNILLVEDNPDDIALTVRALERNKIANHVVIARDGEEALTLLLGTGEVADEQAPIPLPVVVLLDLKLPKVDGLEVLKTIRASKRTRCLPVVILTSSDEEQDRLQSYQLGANSFIRKPVSFEQLIDAIKQLQLYWLVLNEPPPGVDA